MVSWPSLELHLRVKMSILSFTPKSLLLLKPWDKYRHKAFLAALGNGSVHRAHKGVEEKYGERVPALSAGAYTTTLYVMV
jgi:hypothetical protein